MDKFLTVATLIAPLLVLVLVGYSMRRLDYFPAPAVKGLGAFITKVAIPAALFSMIATQNLAEILDARLIFGYMIATAGIAAITFFVARALLSASDLRAMTMAFGTSTSNAVMIGFPIIPLAFGQAGSAAITILFLVQSCILIPLKLALWGGFHSGTGTNLKTAGKLILEAIKNPIIAGILAGMGVAFIRLILPEAWTNGLTTLAAAPWVSPFVTGVSGAAGHLAATAAGLALFFMGCSLYGAKFLPLDPQATATALFKLLGHPALMTLAMLLMSLTAGAAFNWEVARACIALAAIPMISVYPAVASQYGEEEFASKAATFTLLLGAITLTIALLLTLP